MSSNSGRELPPAFVRALSLARAGRSDEAESLLREVVASDPDCADAWYVLGASLASRGAAEEGVQALRRAVEIRPGMPAAWRTLGLVLFDRGEVEPAAECFREVVALLPDDPRAHANLAFALKRMRRLEEAHAVYQRALAIDPRHVETLNHAAFALQELGRFEEASALYARALALDPRSADAAYNFALVNLFLGELEAAWAHYESRFLIDPPVAVDRGLALPRFTANDRERSRRVAIWREQGVGDQLLYATLLPELERRGIAFVLEIDPRLVPAIERAHPAWRVVPAPAPAEAFSDCDYQLPLASLGGVLRPSRESFARQPQRLLAADAGRRASIGEALRGHGERIVGISWRSFRPAGRDGIVHTKSAPLEAFADLSLRPGLALVDLQYGDTLDERARFRDRGGRLLRVPDLDLFADIEGVLAAIEACDGVITTSNVTAHFAGALGKAAVLIYRGAHPPFFYWVPGSDGRSLWYPSVEVLGGAADSRWNDLVGRAAARLEARLLSSPP